VIFGEKGEEKKNSVLRKVTSVKSRAIENGSTLIMYYKLLKVHSYET
jgi:hypothetical protein